MTRFRLSIAGLLGLVAFCGVGAAALRASSEAWDAAIFGAVLLGLAVSILRAVHTRGRTRSFWIGFALFGGLYLGASLVPAIEARLPTTLGLRKLNAMRFDPDSVVAVVDGELILAERGPSGGGASAGQTRPGLATDRWVQALSQASTTAQSWPYITTSADVSTEHFLGIGHALLTVVLGVIGGMISRAMAGERSS